MRLIRHGNGKYSCLACLKRMVPVPGRGNRGKRRCPGCGFEFRLPDGRMKKKYLRGGKEVRGNKTEGESYYGQS